MAVCSRGPAAREGGGVAAQAGGATAGQGAQGSTRPAHLPPHPLLARSPRQCPQLCQSVQQRRHQGLKERAEAQLAAERRSRRCLRWRLTGAAAAPCCRRCVLQPHMELKGSPWSKSRSAAGAGSLRPAWSVLFSGCIGAEFIEHVPRCVCPPRQSSGYRRRLHIQTAERQQQENLCISL